MLYRLLRPLLRLARIEGDARAISKGRYPDRVVRRHAHRSLARVLRKGGL